MRKFVTCIILIVFLTGCKSFEPIIIPNQPDECNDFYNVLKYYSVQGGDSAFVGTVYEKCSQARKDKNIAEIKRLNEKVTSLCEQLNPESLDDFKRCMK
jgi:hypothetical protein